MNVIAKNAQAAKVDADVLVLWLDDKGRFGEALQTVDKASEGYFSARQQAGDLPEAGKWALFHAVEGVKAARVLVLCLSAGEGALRQIAPAVWSQIAEHRWDKCVFALQDVPVSRAARVFVGALYHSAYRFEQFKTISDSDKKAAKWRKKWQGEWLLEKKETQVEQDLAWADALNAGCSLTRDLGNTPPNVCTPRWLAEQAEQLAEQYEDLSVKVLKTKEIKALEMGALLCVAQGSVQEPRFITMSYQPPKAVNKKPVVLVGKGVTFDSGGISIKPADGMDLMKYDMGGAAAVFGAMAAVAKAALPVHVVALIPAVENLPSGAAVKPGDIVRSMSGKTIEILNTDAEGRLILCDALTYAERYEPQAVIDLATLTGACVIALGSPRAGLFGNNAELEQALYLAGEAVHDRVWRMPLDEDYLEMMKSPFADLANASSVREAGAVTAAAFLSQFAQKYDWAHLDIAGVAWQRGGGKGGTGRPVALLLEYFTRLAGKK